VETALSDQFRIRDHVAGFDGIVGDIVARSAATRKTVPGIADIAYGTGPNETIDLFFPAERRPGTPVHMFIHGGYWRMFSKRDFSCVADTITAAGAIAVIVDYALMPAVRMATLVDQVRRARDWVIANIGEHGGDPARLSVSGHSAGAHLSSFLFTRDETTSHIRAALLLGGLYALEPLRHSFLQAEIALTDQEVAEFTPMTQNHDAQTRVSILVGADETTPFHRMADDFGARLRSQGLEVSRFELKARNHMDSVRDLAIMDSEAGRILVSAIESV
jgi:arylformamidase